MGSGSKPRKAPLGFASALPLTRAEKAACREARDRRVQSELALIRACRQMGIPLRPLSRQVRRLFARMHGETDDAA
jgi:hypothetical protein